jgi:hypothetical protein
MLLTRWIAALATACAIAFTLPVAAAEKWLPYVVDQPTRFSDPGVYVGKPALSVTLSMIIAGGGPSNFKTLTLMKAMAGSKTDEVASLTKKFGSLKVSDFATIFAFVVSDSLKIVKAKGIALPSVPSPDPKNGEALAGALWTAGQTGHGFNVEVMLDRAVSHPIHLQVMNGIDAKYGLSSDADYYVLLTQAMTDLASVYHFNAGGQPSSM